MNRLTIRDFSNPYSPKNTKNRPFFNKLQGPSTPKSPLSPHSNLSPRSISGRKALNKSAQIANIPYIEEVRKINKLKLSKEKINEITYSLSIDEISRNAFTMRMRADKPYLNFDRNPLSDLRACNTPKNHLTTLKKDKKQTTLFQAFEELKDRDLLGGLKKKKQVQNRNAQDIFVKLKNKENQNISKGKASPQEKIHEDKDEGSRGQTERPPFEELEDIIGLKDENYFMKKRNQEPFNLFQIKFSPNSAMFQSGRQQLNNFYFSFDSMSTNAPSNLNETMLRALSTFSRISVLNSNSRSLPDDFKIDQHNFRFVDFEKIGVDDLIQVANGQMRSDILIKYINDEMQMIKRKVDEDHKTDNEEVKNPTNDKVILKPKQQNKPLNFQADNFQKTELLYLKRDDIAPIESQQKELSSKYLRIMRNTLTEQLKCLNAKIKDNSLHRTFIREKDKILQEQMEADAELSKRLLETERKIRLNKVCKNQTQKLKIQEVTQTCRQRQALEKEFKTQSKSRNKSGGKQKGRSKSGGKSKSKVKG